MKFLKLGLASLVASSALFAGTYNVDASHSNVGFSIKHMMITNVSGKFNDVLGTFDYELIFIDSMFMSGFGFYP